MPVLGAGHDIIVIRDNSASNCILVGREVDGGVETTWWGGTPINGRL